MKRVVKPRRLALLVLIALPIAVAWSEYGDVVINVRAQSEGMSPVVFPHWFHRVRFQCSVCHVDIGFKTRAGGSGITMDKISQGQYCGACHTGVQGGHETSGPGYW
jgi:c(7)-type cytochrome triheme protein